MPSIHEPDQYELSNNQASESLVSIKPNEKQHIAPLGFLLLDEVRPTESTSLMNVAPQAQQRALLNELNVNNGANHDQLLDGSQSSREDSVPESIVRAEGPSAVRQKPNKRGSTLSARSSKYIPFMYDSLPETKNSQSSIQVGKMDLAVARKTSSASQGRQFVRSSSIMVNSSGREVSALDLSLSKGHIACGEREMVEASSRGNINLMQSFSSSIATTGSPADLISQRGEV